MSVILWQVWFCLKDVGDFQRWKTIRVLNDELDMLKGTKEVENKTKKQKQMLGTQKREKMEVLKLSPHITVHINYNFKFFLRPYDTFLVFQEAMQQIQPRKIFLQSGSFMQLKEIMSTMIIHMFLRHLSLKKGSLDTFPVIFL